MKLQSSSETLRFIWQYVIKYKRHTLLVLFFVLLSSLAATAGPYVYKLYIDSFATISPPVHGLLAAKTLTLTLALYIVITLFEAIIFEFATFAYMPFMGYTTRDLLMEAYAKVMRLSFRYHASQKAGTIYAKILRGENSLDGITDTFVFSFIPLFFKISFLIILVAFIQGWIALLILIQIVIFVAWIVFSTHEIQRREKILSDTEDHVSGSITDSLTNIESIMAFGAGTYRELILESQVAKTLDIRLKTWRLYPKVYMVIGLIVTAGFASVFVVATSKFLSGEFSIGDVVFLGSSLSNLMVSMYYLAHRYGRFRQALTKFGQYRELLQQEEEIQDPQHPVVLSGFHKSIEFHRVSFSYGDRGSERAIHDVSFRIPKGSMTAIVGHSGAGKSSIMKLLLRFYDVQSGSICLDGVDIRTITQENLHQLASLVPQDPSMFHDTVAKNILFGRPHATMDEVRDAARRAYAHSFIEQLPNGYDTIVGERGVKLSGGQRQRVAIVRAILANRPIVLFDEATSSLDSVSELAIQEGLRELLKETTTVTIAHRLSTIQHADQIIVLDQGRVIDQGTHKELLLRCAIYKELWDLQSGGFLAS